MILIPAIDIKNNNCVRLKKGDFNKYSIFSKNPLIVFNKWINYNIKRIHLVDLNGASQGNPKNLLSLKNIINFNKNNLIKIQIGGGIRNVETVEYYLELGFSYIVLGTRAITDLNFLENICYKYSNKIILGLDLKNFKIAIDGWKKYYNLNLSNFLRNINNMSLESVIYTDVSRDGTLKGINITNFKKITNLIKKPIIISGGLASLNDLKILFNSEKKLLGVICGTSIYKGNINIKSSINKINYFNKFYVS